MTLELKPGEPDELLISQDEQIKEAMNRMAQQVQKDSADIGQIHQALAALMDVIGKMNPQAAMAVSEAMQKNAPQQEPEPAPVEQM